MLNTLDQNIYKTGIQKETFKRHYETGVSRFGADVILCNCFQANLSMDIQ